MITTSWDERYAVSDMLCSGQPNIWVKEYCEELPAGQLLDLAGGEGRNALWLAQQGWEATVVDCSQGALDRASHCAGELRISTSVRVVRADIRKYLPSHRAFDLVLIAYLHLAPAERNAVLALAVSAVAPGGRLMVIGHDKRNLAEGIGGPQDANLLFTPEEIVVQLEGLGLQIAHSQTRERLVETDQGARSAFDAVIIAARV
ncbi:MAG: class I SAM-dependent methyltransferase [Actinomycetota bacterium]|nr:class I SAM-dependent methyltransferase [Actinomycetota bacterium]